MTLLPCFQSAGGRHAVLCCELQGVDDSKNLLEISASRRGIQNWKLELLVRAKNEDGPGSQGNPGGVDLIGVQHTKFDSEFTTGVWDDRVSDTGAWSVALNVRDPFSMRVHAIAAQSENLYSPFLKLREIQTSSSQLRCAHWGEVIWMREKNGPRPLDRFVKIDLPQRWIGFELRGHVPELQRHVAVWETIRRWIYSEQRRRHCKYGSPGLGSTVPTPNSESKPLVHPKVLFFQDSSLYTTHRGSASLLLTLNWRASVVARESWGGREFARGWNSVCGRFRTSRFSAEGWFKAVECGTDL